MKTAVELVDPTVEELYRLIDEIYVDGEIRSSTVTIVIHPKTADTNSLLNYLGLVQSEVRDLYILRGNLESGEANWRTALSRCRVTVASLGRCLGKPTIAPKTESAPDSADDHGGGAQ